MAKLINGNGNPAIYAAEDADLIASLAGNVTCIANVGNKYAATEEDATTIRLDDGVIITKEGRRIQLEAGESDTFYIPTGTSGQTNYYIIGYKLVQNADSTQVAEQFVQKMNSSSETITEDTFRSGATEVYVSVYRVTQVGFTIDSISGLLPELLDNASIKDNIDQINSDKVSKSGDTITGNIHISSSTTESPRLYFDSSTGYNYIENEGNGSFRIRGSDDLLAHISKDSFVMNDSPNLVYSRKINSTSNLPWKNAPVPAETTYYYEGADTTTLDLPDANCFLTVQKFNSGRGIAMAYCWPNGANGKWWINNLHDTWRGWRQMPM